MKLTANTMTDDQIRELRDQLYAQQLIVVSGDMRERISRANDISECETALIETNMPHEQRDAARARCAEIFNARRAAQDGQVMTAERCLWRNLRCVTLRQSGSKPMPRL